MKRHHSDISHHFLGSKVFSGSDYSYEQQNWYNLWRSMDVSHIFKDLKQDDQSSSYQISGNGPEISTKPFLMLCNELKYMKDVLQHQDKSIKDMSDKLDKLKGGMHISNENAGGSRACNKDDASKLLLTVLDKLGERTPSNDVKNDINTIISDAVNELEKRLGNLFDQKVGEISSLLSPVISKVNTLEGYQLVNNTEQKMEQQEEGRCYCDAGRESSNNALKDTTIMHQIQSDSSEGHTSHNEFKNNGVSDLESQITSLQENFKIFEETKSNVQEQLSDATLEIMLHQKEMKEMDKRISALERNSFENSSLTMEMVHGNKALIRKLDSKLEPLMNEVSKLKEDSSRHLQGCSKPVYLATNPLYGDPCPNYMCIDECSCKFSKELENQSEEEQDTSSFNESMSSSNIEMNEAELSYITEENIMVMKNTNEDRFYPDAKVEVSPSSSVKSTVTSASTDENVSHRRTSCATLSTEALPTFPSKDHQKATKPPRSLPRSLSENSKWHPNNVNRCEKAVVTTSNNNNPVEKKPREDKKHPSVSVATLHPRIPHFPLHATGISSSEINNKQHKRHHSPIKHEHAVPLPSVDKRAVKEHKQMARNHSNNHSNKDGVSKKPNVITRVGSFLSRGKVTGKQSAPTSSLPSSKAACLRRNSTME